MKMFTTAAFMAVSMAVVAHAEETKEEPEAATLNGDCLQCILYGNYYCTNTNDQSVQDCVTADSYNTDSSGCPNVATAFSQCPSSVWATSTQCPQSQTITDDDIGENVTTVPKKYEIPAGKGCRFSVSTDFTSYTGLAGFQFKSAQMANATPEDPVDLTYLISDGATWDATSSAHSAVKLIENGAGRINLPKGETRQLVLINTQENDATVNLILGQGLRTVASLAVLASTSALAYWI